VTGLRDLYARHRASLGQFSRFCLVGASGVLVNLVVAYLCKKGAPLIWPQAQENAVLWDLPGVKYNIRWYHLFSMVAFLVANLTNYQLNRSWTFQDRARSWFGPFTRFFMVGLLSQLVGMGVETALMNANSPIQLPSSVFDDSTGLRTKWYWAHLIMIMVTIPVSFLLNKFWTFRRARTARRQGEP
jgi:putative flippase GtrA